MTKLLRLLKRNGRDESGQALVEFAITIPLLLLLLLGMMEWGFLLWTKMTFVNAAREGSRNAVVMREWGSMSATYESEIVTLVADRLSPLPATVKSGVEGRISIELLPSAADIKSIRVSIVDQPYTPLIGFAKFIVPATLSASVEFRYEAGI